MARPRDYPYGATIHSDHLTFAAGAPCLDLANTRELRKGAEPQEYLHAYGDLLVFARRVSLLPATQIRRLEKQALGRPRRAAAVFRRAILLREAIYRLVAATAHGDTPPADALARVDDERREAADGSELVFERGRFGRRWRVTDLRGILWPIAESIATLLLDEQRLPLLRECAGTDCGWVFLDRSRSRRRRWCDMSACGNRAKAARHYERRRTSRAPRLSGGR